MVTFIIVLVIVGLIAGAIARLLVPGRDSMGIVATILLGIVGSWPAASKKAARMPSRASALLAGVPGLEPRLTGPEPVGLPITPYPMGSSHRGPGAPVQCSRTAALRPMGSADRPGQPQYKSPDDRFAGPDRPAVRGSGA